MYSINAEEAEAEGSQVSEQPELPSKCEASQDLIWDYLNKEAQNDADNESGPTGYWSWADFRSHALLVYLRLAEVKLLLF